MRMESLKKNFMVAAVIFWAWNTVAGADNIRSQRHILDNGMTVVLRDISTSPAVAIYALVKTGSTTEGKYLGCGISHFVEHMLFKGTEDKRAVGQIAQEVMALGGTINASTGFDYTIYTVDLPKEQFDKGLNILADMLINSKFDPAEVEKERGVILGEMRLYNDNPERRLDQMIYNTVYQRHPYKFPVIGYESLFKSITRDGLWDYYKTTYIPDSIVFSVAGNIDMDHALVKIKDAFKDFNRRVPLPRNLPAEPRQVSSRWQEGSYPTDLTRMSMAYRGVSVADEHMFALDVLSMILGQGESSRLYREVYKNKGLVYSISAVNFTPVDPGIFEISAVLDEKNLYPAIDAIKGEIEKIKTAGVDPKELEKTKRQILAQYISGYQTSSGVADYQATNEAMVGDFEFAEKYVEAIKKLTPLDIETVARDYLRDEQSSIVVLHPKSEETSGLNAAKTEAAHPIQKFILDNGLTVLVREDPTFPLVSVSLVMQGGVRQENEQNNGLFELTSRLWVKGTKTRTAQQIAEEKESRAVGLGGFSGRNSFGLQMDFLSEDLGFGLDLLEDVVKNSTFPEEELKKEKEQMQTAIQAREDNISLVSSLALRQTLFLTHPSRLDSLGSKESVERLNRKNVLDVYEHYVAPNNMVLAIFGDVHQDDVLSKIKKKFGSLPKRDVILSTKQESAPLEPREKTVYMEKEQAMVMIGFQGTTIHNTDRYGLEVLTSILGSSFKGRIFSRIREELGQAYTLGGAFTPGIDPGVIAFYVLTTPDHIDQVQEILKEQIQNLQKEEVSLEELQATKTFLKGTFKMDLETNSALGFASALDELYGLGYDQYEHFADHIDQVTPQELMRLAKAYLDLSKAAIVITRSRPANSQQANQPTEK